jgi:methionyl aminopeptidase
MISIKTEAEIAAMRKSGRMLATVLEYIRTYVQAGMTPKDVSLVAAKELERLGGTSTFKGFEGYPDIICISTNNEVQHTIPNNHVFVDGDIVNFDFGVTYDGMVTDAGISLSIGGLDKADAAGKRLLEGTERALYAGLDQVKDGCRVGDISAAIEAVLRAHDLGIVRELVGHGVGYEMHEDPEIPNYGRAGTGPILKGSRAHNYPGRPPHFPDARRLDTDDARWLTERSV